MHLLHPRHPLAHSIVAAAACLGCARTEYLVPAAAARGSNDYGLAITHRPLAKNEMPVVGLAAHSGTAGDVTWRVQPEALQYCTATPAGPRCIDVNTDGVDPDAIIALTPHRDWASGGGEMWNAVWVRGVLKSPLAASRGRLAFCTAVAGQPTCKAATLPLEGAYFGPPLAGMELLLPEQAQVVWLEAGDVSATFWWGPMAGGKGFVRCKASRSQPEPRCSLATFER